MGVVEPAAQVFQTSQMLRGKWMHRAVGCLQICHVSTGSRSQIGRISSGFPAFSAEAYALFPVARRNPNMNYEAPYTRHRYRVDLRLDRPEEIQLARRLFQ